MYTSWMNATASRPISKLVGFERYSVKKGTSVSGSMTISSKQLQLNDAVKGWTVEPGLYKTTNVASQLQLLLWFCFFFPVVPNPMESHHIFLIFTFIKGISLNLFYTCIYFNVYFGYFCDCLSFQGLLPYLLVASNQSNTIWADPTL